MTPLGGRLRAGCVVELHSKSDERLAELVREGSAAAFEAMVVRHRKALVRDCERILGQADAEEAVQEALLRANRALVRGLVPRVLSPWLRAIARNTALTLARRRGDARALEAGYADDHADQTDDSAAWQEDLRDVLAAVRVLPVRQRQAIMMLALEGQSYAEIAVRLNTTPHAVGQLINRARKALQRSLVLAPSA